MIEEREPRRSVSIQGRYRTGSGIARDVVVSDVSTMGCKFYDRFSNLDVNSRLTIRLGNIGPLDAVVRWRTGQLVGVKFETGLHASVIDHMVTTISDWSAPQLKLPPAQELWTDAPSPKIDEISIKIREPTAMDFRLALSDLGLQLPLNQFEDVEAVFHHVLNAIFLRSSDDEGRG